MSKADTLAKLVSTGGPMVDGAVAVSDISGLQTTLDGKLALSGGTLTGNLTFNGTQTWPTFNQNTTGSAATATTSTNVSGGTANVTTLITSSTVTLNGGTANGVTYLNGSKVLTSGSALTFDGVGGLGIAGATPRLLSNMSGTLSTRFIIQNSTTNGNSRIYLYPNGTGNISAINGVNNSDVAATDYQAFDLAVIGTTDVRLSSSATGAAAFLPLTFYTNGSEQMRLTSTGLGIGTTSPGNKLHVQGSGDIARFTNGSNSVYFAPDSAGVSIFSGAGQTGSGLYIKGSDTSLQLWTASANRATLDSSGNLGLGVTPSAWGSDTRALQIFNRTSLSDLQSTTQLTNNGSWNGSGWIYRETAAAGNYNINSGAHVWRSAASGTAGNAISFTQAMTLDASGNLGVGTTSPGTRLELAKVYVGAGSTWAGGDDLLKLTAASGSAWAEPAIAFHEIGSNIGAKIGVKNTGNGAMNIIFANRDGSSLTSTMTERARIDVNGNLLVGKTASDTTVIGWGLAPNGGHQTVNFAGSNQAFVYNQLNTSSTSTVAFRVAGTERGNISWTNSGVSYNTSSDYRLKHDIAPMTGALAKVAALKPVTYKWNADGSDGQGFIAHELAEVVPDAVTGDKDAVDADGKPVYQGIDTSFLVATLTAAIQELKAEFDAYKSTHP